MANNEVTISAGLPVSKEGSTPSGNTVYIAAGLPPAVVEEPPTGLDIPIAEHHYQMLASN